MAASAKAVHYRRDASERHYALATRTLVAISGFMLSTVGALVAIGGYLSPLGGSAFHMLVGVTLIVSGVLVAKRNRFGAWTHLAVFATTVSWSLRGLEGGSSLFFRLVGPAAVLAVLALLLPVLCHWRPRQAVAAFAIIMACTIALSAASGAGEPLARATAAVTRFLDSQTEGMMR